MNMEGNHYEFNFEKAKKAIQAYSRSTGTEVLIINSAGKPLYQTFNKSILCKFCGKIELGDSKSCACSSVHLYGSYQAERFGGEYVYFCPLGFVHWASPIIKNNSVEGAFIGGPVLMVDPEEFLLEDLIKQQGIEDVHLKEINEYIKQVPVIQPDVVKHLSELLSIVASSISDQSYDNQDQKKRSHDLQSGISQVIHQIKQIDREGSQETGYPFEKERELLSTIAAGDKATSQKILNEILGYVFFSSGKDIQVIKLRILELVVLLSRAAVEGGADSEEIFGLNHSYLSDINRFRSVEELTFWLSKIMARFTDCVFNLADVRHKDIIYKAINYIKLHYRERITLEDVALHVYLTPSYFSKIFKNEMKCNFVTYVNNMRIHTSQKLLLDISIPLTEISGIVGFEDQSYFTKVFKKSAGITPKKYRESMGMSKNHK